MATEFTHPFASGVDLDSTSRFVTAYQEWRRDLCDLEAKRIERDLAALRKGCEAIANAKDWGEFNTAWQAVMSDYCKVTNTLWREGIEIAMRHQCACGDAFSDAMKSWHSTWTGGFEKAAAMTPPAMPLWFKHLSMPAAVAQPPNLQADGSIQSGERSSVKGHLAA